MTQALDLTPIRKLLKDDLPPSKHALADLTVDLIGGLFADVNRIANALEKLTEKNTVTSDYQFNLDALGPR
jgi:hypothetical protein